MNRREAFRRHRRFIVVVAALSGLILVLLAVVAPLIEQALAVRDLRIPAATAAVFRASRFVRSRLALVAVLMLTLVGLAWTAFGLADRRLPRR
jgi:type II secretory pathway component PulF